MAPSLSAAPRAGNVPVGQVMTGATGEFSAGCCDAQADLPSLFPPAAILSLGCGHRSLAFTPPGSPG